MSLIFKIGGGLLRGMNAKIKITIFIVGIILIISIIAFFIIIPTVSDIKKISGAIYTERVDLEKKYLKGQLLKKTVNDFEAIKPQKDKLDTIFIIRDEELKFISTLEGIASRNNVDQTINLQTKEIKQKDGIKALPLKITVTGNFTQVMKYLTNLERLNYYFNISTLNLGASKDFISITLVGDVFSQIKTED